MLKRLFLGLLALAIATPAAAQYGGGYYAGPVTSAQIVAALGYTPLNKAGDTMLGDLLFTDGLYDIGKTGATRPRNIFASGTGTFGGKITSTVTAAQGVQVGAAANNNGAGVFFAGSSTNKNWFIGNQFNVGDAFEITPSAATGTTTPGTVPAFQINSAGSIAISGSLTGQAGQTSSGFTDYVAQAGGSYYWSSRAVLRSPADGQIKTTNNAETTGVILDVATDSVFKVLSRGGANTANILANSLTIGSAATAGTVAIGGATIGANAIAWTGTANGSGAFTLGGALTYGGVTLSNAVTGTGNMVLSASPTLSGTVGGALTFSGATTFSSALTYGGVALSNAVTGTGNMVLSASPTLTGTLTAAAVTASGAVQTAGNFTMTAGTFQYIAAGGSADVQTLTYSPAVTAYATGAMYCFRAVGSNTTTTPTFNVNGLGAKTGVKRASTALAANDVLINGHYCGIYNGTNLQILNPTVP